MKAYYLNVAILGLFALPLAAAEKDMAKVLFEDKFESKLGKDWSWLREDPKAWRIDKDGLEIRALPGHGTERKNILLGPAHRAKEELAFEVLLYNQPTGQWEHAGLQCYFDERNWVGLVKEKTGKPEIVLTQRKNGNSTYATAGCESRTVYLRMVLSGGKATGFFRVNAKDEWKKMGQCDQPSDGEFRLGLAAGGGGKNEENWARFRNFQSCSLPAN